MPSYSGVSYSGCYCIRMYRGAYFSGFFSCSGILLYVGVRASAWACVPVCGVELGILKYFSISFFIEC